MPRSVMLVFLSMSGCYTVRFYDGEVKAAGADRGEAHSLWVQSFLWGMIPAGKVDVSICRHGVKKMKSQIGGLGLLAYALTGGLWTPMHVKIVCADPAEPSAAPPEPSTKVPPERKPFSLSPPPRDLSEPDPEPPPPAEGQPASEPSPAPEG